MKNNWHQIWDNRKKKFEEIDLSDDKNLIINLKKIVGWDFFGKGSTITVEDFKKEYEYVRDNLQFTEGGGSVFEVGCGSGVNIYFFKQDGFKIGCEDYSQNLIDIAKKVIGEENLIECICGDAAEIPTAIKYDAVVALSVFQYFSSIEYAKKVLDLMVEKATKSIGITQILNEETKDNYLKYRREVTENYDELYKDLPKLFISKKFFIEYAEKNNLDVKFPNYQMKGFWNAPYNFDCFLYKK